MKAELRVVYPREPIHPPRARVELPSHHLRNGRSTMSVTTYGFDLAKQVFQVHWVELDTGEVRRRTLRRPEVSAFFAQRPPGLIAMEACGSGHHWGRLLRTLGHEVRLLPPQFVAPFVKTNKSDAADAEAIWEAVQRPGMRFVAVKTEEQQAILSLHRLRRQTVKVRSMQACQIRSLLYEFGFVAPTGWRNLLEKACPILADETRSPVPEILRRELLTQLDGLKTLTTRVVELERELDAWQKRDSECQRIRAIPGVGKLTATAIVATIADARTFRSGREFAAFLGLVPAQSGTGGRVRLLGISKRGDAYLRTLLIHGARAVLTQAMKPERTLDPWLKALLSRRPKNVVIVALANKIARTVWALLAHGRVFDRGWNESVAGIAAAV